MDAGLSGKKVEECLNSIDMTTKDISGILVTHEHSDHIQGIGVLARKYKIPIYATGGTASAILRMPLLGEIPHELIHVINADEKFFIHDLEIKPFSISHDAAEPVGYKVSHGKKSVGIATDLGTYDDYIIDNLLKLDVLLVEANHDVNMLLVGSYPYRLKQRILGKKGHLSNDSAGMLLNELLHNDLKAVVLGHLSQENNYEALAYETVCQEVTMGNTPYKASDFRILVAKRNTASERIEV